MSEQNGSAEQERIRNWFDRTYAQRGERYLRPVKAYYIYLELLDIQAGTRLLDVACGLGRVIEAGRDYPCEVVGVDISEVAIKHTQAAFPEATSLVANAQELPFPDGEFDYITCIGSLERIVDVKQALREMKRVAKPDATFCFLVRNANTLRWKVWKEAFGMRNDEAHQDAKTLATWKDLFASMGFETRRILPDQYPLHRRQARCFWRDVDYRTVVESKEPLERANEFLFLLKAAHEADSGSV